MIRLITVLILLLSPPVVMAHGNHGLSSLSAALHLIVHLMPWLALLLLAGWLVIRTVKRSCSPRPHR